MPFGRLGSTSALICVLSRVASGVSFPHNNSRSDSGTDRHNTVSEGGRRPDSCALHPITVSGDAEQEDADGEKLLRTAHHAPRVLIFWDQDR